MLHLYTDKRNFWKYHLGEEEFEAWNKEAKKPGDVHISVPVDAVLQFRGEDIDHTKIFTIKARKDWPIESKDRARIDGSTIEGNIVVHSFYEDDNFVLETKYKGYTTRLSLNVNEIQANPDEAMRKIFAKAIQLPEAIEKFAKMVENAEVSVMKDVDLTKGSGQLYGEGDYLGRIKLVDNKTIKKSETIEEDELKKSDEDKEME